MIQKMGKNLILTIRKREEIIGIINRKKGIIMTNK
jgi:hypothetical protein